MQLPWAQEVWSINLRAPTTRSRIFHSLLLPSPAPETPKGIMTPGVGPLFQLQAETV